MGSWDREVAKTYVNLGKQSHVEILAEPLRRLHADWAGARVLDFGCGGGELTWAVAGEDAGQVVGLDENEQLLERARRYVGERAEADERFSFALADEHSLPAESPFDVVLCSLALMMSETRQRLYETVAGLIGSVTDTGSLLIVLTHPCFHRPAHRTFHIELPDDYTYWQSGRPFDVVLDPPDETGRSVIRDHHWMLSDYAEAIHAGGGRIRTMDEAPGEVDEAGQPLAPPAYLLLAVERA